MSQSNPQESIWEQEQQALTRLALEEEQNMLINKLWDGEYYHNAEPILAVLGDIAIQLTLMGENDE